MNSQQAVWPASPSRPDVSASQPWSSRRDRPVHRIEPSTAGRKTSKSKRDRARRAAHVQLQLEEKERCIQSFALQSAALKRYAASLARKAAMALCLLGSHARNYKSTILVHNLTHISVHFGAFEKQLKIIRVMKNYATRRPFL